MPEHDIFEGGRKLPLMEEFYSLQGEGYHTGRASYFIRIGGCDIGCSWCDSKRSWSQDRHPLVEVDDIVSRAAGFPSGILLNSSHFVSSISLPNTFATTVCGP